MIARGRPMPRGTRTSPAWESGTRSIYVKQRAGGIVLGPMVRAPTKTILIADDDHAVRQALAEMLQKPDYTVLTASDGYEALGLLPGRRVDLLVTDVRMPGMSGFELARRAKAARPALRVVYLSGYATVPDRGGVNYGPLIRKPIRSQELLKIVSGEVGQ